MWDSTSLTAVHSKTSRNKENTMSRKAFVTLFPTRRSIHSCAEEYFVLARSCSFHRQLADHQVVISRQIYILYVTNVQHWTEHVSWNFAGSIECSFTQWIPVPGLFMDISVFGKSLDYAQGVLEHEPSLDFLCLFHCALWICNIPLRLNWIQGGISTYSWYIYLYALRSHFLVLNWSY